MDNNEFEVSSRDFANTIKVAHSQVVKRIKKIIQDVPETEKDFKGEYISNNKNRKYLNYKMNRDGYLLLLMSTSSKGNKERQDIIFNLKNKFTNAYRILSEQS